MEEVFAVIDFIETLGLRVGKSKETKKTMMMILGIVLILVALGALGFAFWQWRKLAMMSDAPLVKTAELVGNASEKGLISVEGKVEAAGQFLTSPVTGTPCLYYQVVVKQKVEKQVKTQDGYKNQTNTNTAKTESVGGQFLINDGSGPAKVDATEGKVNAKLEQTFKDTGNAHGNLQFGNYSVHIPRPNEGWAKSTECIEKIVPADGEYYVAGRLEGDTIMRKKNMGGKLIIARGGAEAMQGETAKKMKIGGGVGALLLVAGIVMAATGKAPESTGCGSIALNDSFTCTDRMFSASSDATLTWNVAAAGQYVVEVEASGNGSYWPSFRLTGPDGTVLANETSTYINELQPGTYTISIDIDEVYFNDVSGGLGYSLSASSGNAAAQ